MAEPLGVISAVAQILTTCITLCRTTAELVDQIQKAPKHIAAIASDLRAFYSVLGTIQAYLGHEETQTGVLHPSTSSDVQTVLKNCVTIFLEFHKIVHEFHHIDMRLWERVKWTWKHKEVLQLRDQLGADKITLNVAIATANLINTTRTDATTAGLEQDVRELKSTLTALLERLDRAEERRTESDVLVINYEATLCRVAHDATSVLSSVSPGAEPQLSIDMERVASIIASRSTFETAPLFPANPTSYDSNAIGTPDLEYTGAFFRLFVYFHGTPESVEQVKSYFRQKAVSMNTTNLPVLCQTILQ